MLNIVTYFTAHYKAVPSSLVLPKLKFLINPYVLESQTTSLSWQKIATPVC